VSFPAKMNLLERFIVLQDSNFLQKKEVQVSKESFMLVDFDVSQIHLTNFHDIHYAKIISIIFGIKKK
jgi:hypothetical protein